jgi:branched-chain amino acid transport system permease protein
MGAVYTLIALGLTLIYGVLHIINFAHGAALMMALFAVYGLNQFFGLDPYACIIIVVPAMFVFGYTLQRLVIERASHERDENILLVTLGVSIVMENLALILFHSDTRSIDSGYTLSTVTLLGCVLARAKVIAFVGAMVVSALLVGVVRGITIHFEPAASEASMYVLMFLVLMLRPRGLLGERIERFE